MLQAVCPQPVDVPALSKRAVGALAARKSPHVCQVTLKAANPALVNSELLREIQFDPAAGMWRGEMFALQRGEFVPMTIKMTATGFEMVAGSGFMSKTVARVRVQ
ncbi:MAG: hypothetical protein ACOYK7_13245 [Pirellulales bacterium]